MSAQIQNHPVIWTCWLQGAKDPELPYVNKICLEAWKNLNQGSEVVLVDDHNVDDFVPEYRQILATLRFERSPVAMADLLRLLLLKRYGGVWVDVSVFPMFPLNVFLPLLVNEAGFFAYRFMPRVVSHKYLLGDRELASWFLAVERPGHPLISLWLKRYLHYFLASDPYIYYSIHQALCDVYDCDPGIRETIAAMRQISASIPHSLVDNRLAKIVERETAKQAADDGLAEMLQRNQRVRFHYSFLYKRPLQVDALVRISKMWLKDIQAGRVITVPSPSDSDDLLSRRMLSPLIGKEARVLLQACLHGLCFFDSKLPDLALVV